MRLVRFLVTTILATTTMVFTFAKTALADRYQAGNFTVTINENGENGRTYYGCDSKGNCLFLEYGTGWRDNGWRGITWSNGDYFYSISWKEGESGPMYLTVVDPQGKRIVNEVMIPLD